MPQSPSWTANVQRVKVKPEAGADWRANFLELRERHIRVVADNIRLRGQLADARRRRSSRRSRYNPRDETSEYDEDLDRRMDGIRRGGTLDTEW